MRSSFLSSDYLPKKSFRAECERGSRAKNTRYEAIKDSCVWSYPTFFKKRSADAEEVGHVVTPVRAAY